MKILKWAMLIAPAVFIVCLVLSGQAAFGQKPQEPDEARFKNILADLESYAVKGMKDWQVQGMAIAVVRNDKLVYAKGFGIKESGKSDPVDEHTIFQIGSTSKAFTAALVAMMVDEKKVEWEDRVIDHLPDFRMYDPWVTREFMVEELLAQHSGMAPYSGDGQSFLGFDRAHIMKTLRYIKPVSSFRSKFAYVNNLFLVAAAVVEKHTGKSWETNIEERIFKPVGMTESSESASALMMSKNAATGHSMEDGKIEVVKKSLNWPYVYGPAGGINSNVIDMSKWLRLQINDGEIDGKRIVSAENMHFMHSPKTIAMTTPEGNKYYCESWVYDDTRPYPMIWHNGGTTGYHTMLAFWPDVKLGIVILTNTVPNELAEVLPKYLNDLYFDNPRRDWSSEKLVEANKKKADEAAKKPKKSASPMKAMPLDKYAGTYHNDVYEDAVVSAEGAGLTVTLGPDKIKMLLKHWDKDTFSSSIPAFGSTDSGFVTFSSDAAGNVTGMVIDMFNSDGLGEFERQIK